MKKYLVFLLIILLTSTSCKKSAPGDTTAPTMSSTLPSNGATRVSATSWVYITYDEDVVLEDNYQIFINGVAKTATASGKQVRITITLTEGMTYNVVVSANSVKDLSGNYAAAVSFSFTTKYPQPTDGKYEAEYALFSSTNSIMTSLSGYSGTGYVGGFHNSTDFVTFDLENITAGKFDLYIGYSTSNYGAKN